MRAWAFTALFLMAAEPAQDAAREHYRKGTEAYDRHEYDRAALEFKQAYDASGAPALLFNLGQAHRLNGDYAQARDDYRAYLRQSPDAPNRTDVQSRIDEMERRMTPARPAESTPTRAASRPAPHSPPDWAQAHRDSDAHPGLGLKIAGIASGASGLALVGAGVYYGLRADSYSDQVTQLSKNKGEYGPSAQTAYQDGQTAASRSTTLFVIGGAALVGGGVLYGLGVHEERTHVVPTPMAGGGGIVVSGRFR
jgi:tetratricopeptide (TPR) repeat protein